MNMKENMERRGMEFLGETEDARRYWQEEFGIITDEEAIITYGLLRHQGVTGRPGEATLRCWPKSSSPMALKWEKNVVRIENIEIEEGGIRKARYSPGKAVRGIGDIEILRIAGQRQDLEEYRKSLDSLERDYTPVKVPIYRHSKDENGSYFALEGEAVMYLDGDCPRGERPERCKSWKEVIEKVKEPIVLVRGNDGTDCYMGRKR
ncbi:MAG: hypothetical protein ACE5J7_04255 [Candidatus Aenigmatarchaeota archaeon]